MSLKTSIQKTTKYASFFDFDLTLSELHLWLISPQKVSLKDLKKHTSLADHLTKERKKRQKLTLQKTSSLQSLLPILRLIPSIDLVAITGSLSMENAKKDDDIDLMIVTKSNTLWLTRLFLTPILRLFFNARTPKAMHPKNTICLNLWLDTKSLLVPKRKQNLYTAHEVLQIKPILNRGNAYQLFLQKNSWTKRYLANAYHLLTKPESTIKPPTNPSRVVCYLNKLAFRLQYLYMKSKITREHITLHSAYFHPNDPSSRLLPNIVP